MGSRGRLATEFAWFAGSTIAFQGSRLATGLIAASALGPSEFATWGLVLAMLSYSVYLNLGIASGLNLELPRLTGAGQHAEGTQTQSDGLTGSVAAAVLVGGAVAILGGLVSLDAQVVVLTAVAAGVQQLYLYAQSVLRSQLRFNAASFQQLALAVAFPAVALPLLGMGAGALVLGQAAAFAVGVVLVWGVVRTRPSLSLRRTLRLAAVGFPIMLAGFAFAVLTSVDRWAVLTLLGESSVGLYTLAALISSSALLLSMVVAQQAYPRMARALGRGEQAQALLHMALLQSAAAAALVAPVALLVIVGSPLVVTALLPEYTQSISAMQILSGGTLLLVAASGFTNLLVVLGRSAVYLIVLVGATALELLLAVALAPLGITGIAIATATAFASVFVAAATIAFWTARP